MWIYPSQSPALKLRGRLSLNSRDSKRCKHFCTFYPLGVRQWELGIGSKEGGASFAVQEVCYIVQIWLHTQLENQSNRGWRFISTQWLWRCLWWWWWWWWWWWRWWWGGWWSAHQSSVCGECLSSNLLNRTNRCKSSIENIIIMLNLEVLEGPISSINFHNQTTSFVILQF